jgi:glc operon protein GlcG
MDCYGAARAHFHHQYFSEVTMRYRFALVLIVLFCVPALNVFGQAATTPPQTGYGTSINLETAKKAIGASVVEAKKNNWNMALAVVDTAGFLVYFEKMDGTQLGSVQLAIEKAKTATLFRRPTKVFQDGLAAGGEGLRFLGLTGAIPVEGGFPIIIDGKVVGAIGASGGAGDQDSRVAKAGADSMK